MKNALLITGTLASLMFSMTSSADIVCKAQTSMGPAVVTISQKQVTISGAALQQPQVYTDLSQQWDGHMTELITGQGLAISFESWYGCIHNAQITANIRSGTPKIESIQVGQCSGGSTPDRVCGI
jgi:hypothetical protein